MSDLIEQMRHHVASYKVLSPHRQACLDMCDRIEELESDLEERCVDKDQHNAIVRQKNQRIEELEKSNKNRGAAVVLAQEVIAKNDKRIEELESELDNEREAALFWQAKARSHEDAKAALKEHDDG